MIIELNNFGQFVHTTFTFETVNVKPNGWGKTTMLNAYVWALTGKTLNGFEPRRIDAADTQDTSVRLYLQDVDDTVLYRSLHANGTSVCVSTNGGSLQQVTNAELSERLNVPLRVACANPLLLTGASLTSGQLRKFLAVAEVADFDAADALRKERKGLRERLDFAQRLAVLNIVMPQRETPELSAIDLDFIAKFERMTNIMLQPEPNKVCPRCKQPLPTEIYDAWVRERDDAKAFVDAWRTEYLRLKEQQADYDKETQAIEDARRAIGGARDARELIATVSTRIAEIDAQLFDFDECALLDELPEGVEVRTQQTSKAGNTKSVCTLTIYGVPLKSVNYAERVKVCVALLDNARKLTRCEDIPIFIDGADEVQDIETLAPNLICFFAGEE